jgi:hypothetical protein
MVTGSFLVLLIYPHSYAEFVEMGMTEGVEGCVEWW